MEDIDEVKPHGHVAPVSMPRPACLNIERFCSPPLDGVSPKNNCKSKEARMGACAANT